MNPYDGQKCYDLGIKEITTKTLKKKKSHSKFYDFLIKCLKEGKHKHMLRYVHGTNNTEFEVHFYDMKVHKKWSPECISLFVEMDNVIKEERKKEMNYEQGTKNRFKSNIRKLEKNYIKFIKLDKKNTALTIRYYKILNQVEEVACKTLQCKKAIGPEQSKSGGKGKHKMEKKSLPVKKARIDNDSNCRRLQKYCSDNLKSKENIMVNSGWRITLASADLGSTASNEAQYCSNFASMPINGNQELEFVNLEMVNGCEASQMLNAYEASKMVNGCEASKMVNGCEASKMVNGCEASKMVNGCETFETMNSAMINGSDTLAFMNSELRIYGDEKNSSEESHFLCLFQDNEDMVPLNNIENGLGMDLDENSLLYTTLYNEEKPSVPLNNIKNDLGMDLDENSLLYTTLYNEEKPNTDRDNYLPFGFGLIEESTLFNPEYLDFKELFPL